MPHKSYLAKIHILFKETSLKAHKSEIVSSFSAGRTDSCAYLKDSEALELITYLDSKKNEADTNFKAAAKMKNKIIAMAHELGWKQPDGKIDMSVLNNWCSRYSYLKKELDAYTYKELPKLLTQFEKGPYLSYIKKV
ncbi:hypothetical protein SAMN05428988_1330 [Chitinophaga sp. YR573]|uniref:hypothetical protein n=1 Tax=Chitinophaga sp. YR573 TaxID=1881040 RepID=UPI0008C45EBE|nr:hypothetical protein [Chitinophaga sp. YR573]SEW02115.1 hypothetical protein SAMN05428988_1330 [Chitinophaga sp. YR573]